MISSLRGRKILAVPFLAVLCLLCVVLWKTEVGLPSPYKQSINANNVPSPGAYIRDDKGYFYPSEYFNLAPPGVTPSFKDMDMRGRHSDEIMSVCKNFKHGAGPEIEEIYDYRVPRFKFLKNFKNPCVYDAHSQLVCIPYFYLIGTPKAGSTDIYENIRRHPDIAQRVRKENRFFDRERFQKPSSASFQNYLSLYKDASLQVLRRSQLRKSNGTLVFGDGGPTYAYNNMQWERLPGNEGCLEPRIVSVSYIHYINPAAKLILIARNPIDRLYSAYLFNFKNTGAKLNAEEFHDWATKALEAHEDCFRKHPFRACLYSKQLIVKTVLTVSASIYSRLIMDVLKLFPREQLHVIKMEEYSANLPKHLPKVFEFLELDPLPQKSLDELRYVKKKNPGGHYITAGPMLQKTRKMLYDFYKPFNEELAYILNDDKYLWHEDF